MTRIFRIEYNGAPRHAVEADGAWQLIEGDIFGTFKEGERIASSGHKVLAPIMPSKIVAVGLNYKDHAAPRRAPHLSQTLDFGDRAWRVDCAPTHCGPG
jgi:2-keto-4-pentenoate hydratase/2-oxohepta-3-ene-1,7-dioic acid hydratase in catechol pathway